jgi:hypothetical protein
MAIRLSSNRLVVATSLNCWVVVAIGVGLCRLALNFRRLGVWTHLCKLAFEALLKCAILGQQRIGYPS